jgi:hypothetical protein
VTETKEAILGIVGLYVAVIIMVIAMRTSNK